MSGPIWGDLFLTHTVYNSEQYKMLQAVDWCDMWIVLWLSCQYYCKTLSFYWPCLLAILCINSF